MKGSWKTTTGGIIGAVGLVLIEVGNYAQGKPVNWEAVVLAVGLLVTAINARDRHVTSEDEGMK